MLSLKVYLKMLSEFHFWMFPVSIKQMTHRSWMQNIWKTKDLEEFKQRQLWESAADQLIPSTWILLWCWWHCLRWPRWQLSLMTIMIWTGSTATARASISSVPTERSSWPSGATSVRRKAQIACGRLNVSPHLRVWGSPVTAGGTTSTVLGWSGGSYMSFLFIYLLIDCEVWHGGSHPHLFRM